MNICTNIYLTWNCNFNCAHCEHSCDSTKEHMSLENLQKTWSYLEWMINNPSLRMTVLGITGGEATLHPNFWDVLMPRLEHFHRNFPKTPIELHTNGSIPVPETEFKQKYNKVFSKIIIGRDIFHEQFRQLKHLFLDDYEFFAQEVVLRKNAYIGSDGKLYSAIRPKGRGADIKFPPRNLKRDCQCYINANYEIFLAEFTPTYITFCGERPSNPMVIDNKRVVGYDITNEALIQKAVEFNQLYSGIRCANPCYADVAREDDFI